jgi:hypothetical protein
MPAKISLPPWPIAISIVSCTGVNAASVYATTQTPSANW